MTPSGILPVRLEIISRRAAFSIGGRRADAGPGHDGPHAESAMAFRGLGRRMPSGSRCSGGAAASGRSGDVGLDAGTARSVGVRRDPYPQGGGAGRCRRDRGAEYVVRDSGAIAWPYDAGAGLCGLVLALVPFSLAALLRVRFLVAAVRREAREASRAQDSAIKALGARLNVLPERIEEVRAVPHGAAAVVERGGINLSRRSPALRLHRRGEAAGEIATIATTLGMRRCDFSLRSMRSS